MVYIITFAFILLDFVTGLVKAFATKSYSSTIMREGLFHKSGSILIIVFGSLVEYAQAFMDLGVTIPIATTLCIYVCLMEIGSIIENVCMINPNIMPDKIKSYFYKLATKQEETKTKEVDSIDNVQSE